MHVVIRYLDGRLVEAILLAVSADRMRISLAGCDDAVELTLAHGMWFTESHEPVELEALVSETDLSSVFAEIRPRAHAATRSTV